MLIGAKKRLNPAFSNVFEALHTLFLAGAVLLE